jgi:hypothetical protein
MAEDVATDSIRDTSTHTYDTDHERDGKSVYQYSNNLDAEVTITVYGTYAADGNFTDKVQLGQTTVSSNSSDRDSLAEQWDRVQFEAVATTAPTSGELLIHAHY